MAEHYVLRILDVCISPHCVIVGSELCAQNLAALFTVLCARFIFSSRHAAQGNTDMASLTRSVSD